MNKKDTTTKSNMGGKPKKDKSNSASATSSGYGGGASDSTKAGAGNGGAAGTKDERLEQLQADHELFLQAFESKWHRDTNSIGIHC